MTLKNIHKRLLMVAGVFTAVLSIAAGSPLDETVSALEEWVETERQISVSEAEWETSKSSMENLISIYSREIETLGDLIEEAEKDTSAAETRRTQLNEQSEAVKSIENKVVAAMVEAEMLIKTLQPLLPLPLQEELNPLFNSLPENPKEAKLAIGQRIQPIVAILTQVQKFNQVVTVVGGFREFEAGRTVQTDTIYFGLGVAYYIDQADEHAGMGYIGPEGWEWRDDTALIPAVRNFLNIYQGTQQASYVDMPVSVK